MAPQWSALGTSHSFAVAHGDIAVGFSVNKQDGCFRTCDCGFRRYLAEIEVVMPASVENGDFDGGAEQRSAKPRTGVEELPDTVEPISRKLENEDSATTTQKSVRR
jgi:hypothetical protein